MSTTALLHALIDDAAVFPPGNAPVREAVEAHRGYRRAAFADAIGPLLVRAGESSTLAPLLEPDEGLRVALVVRPGAEDPGILPTMVGQLQRDGRAEVVSLELPVSDPLTLKPATELGLPVWLEVSRHELDRDLDAVAAIGAHAKFRTGGLEPDDYPTESDLAHFMAGAVQRALRFKLTAGLHHAVHSTDADQGFEQHGVANVLLAASLDDEAAMAEVLAERDGRALAERLKALSPDDVSRLRASFASFGCCGVTAPLTELARLGLTTAPTTAPEQP
ncbi:MAG TPA: hypothetical protein VHO27_00120 [Angustibacter sp.]|nr:hypothetical protein [Angustibacter sp.]